jgi:hypothetical protein
MANPCSARRFQDAGSSVEGGKCGSTVKLYQNFDQVNDFKIIV